MDRERCPDTARESEFNPPDVMLGGLSIFSGSRAELAVMAISDSKLGRNKAKLVFDANGHGISLNASSPSFAKLMEEADLIHADGGFLVTASRFLGEHRIAERSATTDMIHDIAKLANGDECAFYLLGGSESVNSACARKLNSLYPRLKIAGRRNGYFSLDDEGSIVDAINESGAKVLWVGLGKPLEQAFSVRNRDSLNVSWIITCGGCFHYITGDYERAPHWMQKLNVEWIHRLISNPRKLFVRYATTTPHALFVLVKHALLR